MDKEGQTVTKTNDSSRNDLRKPSLVKETFLYSKIVPVALALLLVALLAVLVIVGLSLIGGISGG
jgi:hypothetical protein